MLSFCQKYRLFFILLGEILGCVTVGMFVDNPDPIDWALGIGVYGPAISMLVFFFAVTTGIILESREN